MTEFEVIMKDTAKYKELFSRELPIKFYYLQEL